MGIWHCQWTYVGVSSRTQALYRHCRYVTLHVACVVGYEEVHVPALKAKPFAPDEVRQYLTSI